MKPFQFWAIDTIEKQIPLIDPKLASWNAKTDPQQMAVQAYLDRIEKDLGLLPQTSNMFLHMVIDVKNPDYLLHHHDLDNYLYPVVNRLGSQRYKRVSAVKWVGGGSSLCIGTVRALDEEPAKSVWQNYQHDTRGISTDTAEWKYNLQNALKNQNISPLKPGSVELQLVWRCSKRRNWINLWKPTIDTMGPVLGENISRNRFNPNDDRIVSLILYLNIDNSVENAVHINMLWRPYSDCSYELACKQY